MNERVAPDWAAPYLPAGAPVNMLTLYLAAWAWMIANGYVYDNSGPWRCTGERHGVDCSGGCVLAYNMAADALGLPRIGCTNSFNLSAECHQYPRPQWLTDMCGPGVGLMVTVEQSRAFALTLLFHGDNEGQSPDSSGDGHVENGVGGGRTAGAHSHATGLGFRTDQDPHPGFLNAAALPPWESILACLAPAPATSPVEENDMQVFVCPNKPNHPGAHAQFVPAGNALFPSGALIMRDGASIAKDQKTHDPDVRILVPKSHKWVACTSQRDDRGLRVLNDQGDLSPRDAFLWS